MKQLLIIAAVVFTVSAADVDTTVTPQPDFKSEVRDSVISWTKTATKEAIDSSWEWMKMMAPIAWDKTKVATKKVAIVATEKGAEALTVANAKLTEVQDED